MSPLHTVPGRLLGRLRRVPPNGKFRVAPDVTDAIVGRVVDQRHMAEVLATANTGRRVDSRRTFDAVAKALAHAADWRTGAITATHEAIGAAAGKLCGRPAFSHDTVARVVAAAVAAGVLVCPPGMGGMSRKALRGARNQAPTYFVVDPAGTDLRTPPSPVGGTVQVEDSYGPLKDPKSPKFAALDPRRVPATADERREAAQWLRARLLLGAVPGWVLTAMLARHFAAGLSPHEVFRRLCQRPDGQPHAALPLTQGHQASALRRSSHGPVRMLLGILGWRLNLWRDVPVPAARPATTEAPATLPPVSLAGGLRAQLVAAIAAGRDRRQSADAAFRADRRVRPAVSCG